MNDFERTQETLNAAAKQYAQLRKELRTLIQAADAALDDRCEGRPTPRPDERRRRALQSELAEAEFDLMQAANDYWKVRT